MKKQIYTLVILIALSLIGCRKEDGIFSLEGLTLNYSEEGMDFIESLSFPVDLALNDDGESVVVLGHNSQEVRFFIHQANREIKWLDNFELNRLAYRFNRLSNFIKMPSDDYFISGIMSPPLSDQSNLEVSFVRKLSASGKEEWTKTFTDSIYNYKSKGILPISESRILLFSKKGINLSTEVNDYNLSIINLEGEVIAGKDIINRNNTVVSYELFKGANGSFYVSTKSSDEDFIRISHYDSKLSLLWDQEVHFNQEMHLVGLELLPNQWGGIVLIASTTGGRNRNGNVKIFLLDNNGNFVAEKGEIKSNWSDFTRAAIPTKDGNILILANSLSTDQGNRDILLSKMDSDGNILWSANYGGSKAEIGHKIVETQSGNIILLGYQWESTRSPNIFSDKVFILRLNANGEVL